MCNHPQRKTEQSPRPTTDCGLSVQSSDLVLLAWFMTRCTERVTLEELLMFNIELTSSFFWQSPDQILVETCTNVDLGLCSVTKDGTNPPEMSWLVKKKYLFHSLDQIYLTFLNTSCSFSAMYKCLNGSAPLWHVRAIRTLNRIWDRSSASGLTLMKRKFQFHAQPHMRLDEPQHWQSFM